MRTISFRDLLVCEELAHIKNELELLDIKNDDIMSSILKKVGFDVDYPVAYLPSKHRDMQNKVAVGFMAVGEISLNRSFINSNLCSTTERLVASSYTDPSMTRELSNLMGNHINFKALISEEGEGESEDLPNDMLEPDRDLVTAQIRQLEEIRDTIRGSMYNESGDLKTYEEYKKSH